MVSRKFIGLIGVLALLFSCRLEQKQPGEKLLIVCTTGMLGDVVHNICGDLHQVETIMGPGVDPHLYKASPNDIRLLQNADVIVHNGLHLEGKMGEIFEKLRREKLIIQWSDGIKEINLISTSEYENSYDPHIWFDPDLFMMGAQFFVDEISAFDQKNSSKYQEQYSAYKKKVDSKQVELEAKISSVPMEKRILITSHDAFSYFGRKYDFQVKGLQGISTVSEFGIKDKLNLVNYILEKDVNVLFVESSVSSRSLKSVIETCEKKGHNIRIGGTLLSDAMDEKNKLGGTYLGMIEYNVNTIIESIHGE